LKKQLEIVTEIIESESKYLDDLLLIGAVFMEPIQISRILTDEELDTVFCNLTELQNLHKRIGAGINQGLPELTKFTVSNTIKTFLKYVTAINTD
jgi:hypothetical protein